MTTLSNLCPNPSFEVSADGWQALSSTVISQTGITAWSGRFCGIVTTAGLTTGEGVLAPAAAFASASPASAQLRIAGPSGTVSVLVAKNPGGILLAQVTVHLINDWQLVAFPGLALNANDSLYLAIQTTSAQDITFYVDAVMYSPAADLGDYFDGDYPGASWAGTPGLSASTLPLPGAVSLHGGMSMSGRLAIIAHGAVDHVSPPSGQATMSGVIASVTGNPPAGALDDFASWPAATDYDPAMTYASWNTAGLTSGHTGYTRPWGIFYPPLDYPVSDGTNLWNRAAFCAVGMQYASVAAATAQNLTCVQLEQMPLAGTGSTDQTPAPSTYDPPRTLHLTVKPTRLNFTQNPAFQAAGIWSGAGNGTLTYDPQVIYPLGGAYDGQPLTNLVQSGKVTIASGNGGTTQQLGGLFTGDTYIASVYVRPGPGIADFQVTAGSGTSASIANPGGTGLTPGTWYRTFVIFKAPAPVATLTITALPGAGAQYPAVFWCGPCLTESGDILGSYFDGSFSNPDYMWETGSTPGLGRSYYYEDSVIQQPVITGIMSRHTPLGLTWAPPLYATLPSQ